MNFSQAIDVFLRRKGRDLAISKGAVSKGTMETYKYRIEDFARFLLCRKQGEEAVDKARADAAAFEAMLGDLDIESVSSDDIADYLFECQQKGIAAPTINARLYTLRSLWKEFAKADDNDIKDITKSLPRARYQYQRKPSVTREHMQKIMNQFKAQREKNKNAYRNFVFYNCIRLFGLRISEALGLDVDSVHILSDSVKLQIVGKGNKYRLRTLPLKDAKGVDLPVARSFHEELEHYMNSVRPKFKDAVKDKGPVFLSQTGGRWNEDSARLAFKKCLKACELQMHRYTPHSLRHAFVSHKLADGVPLQTVSKLVDHANVQITSTIYAHSEEQDLIDGMTKGLE